MNFSKSKYCALWQCPKMAWLDKYKPELRQEDATVQARFVAGTEVGELAKGIFGEYSDVTEIKPDGGLDLGVMLERTHKLVASGANTICEAAFSFGGLYCAVDILHREGDGYAIYEVKSSAHLKYIHAVDVAYQKYVLTKCGIRVTGVNLVDINSDYVRHGDIDIKQLFKINDLSEMIADEEVEVENNLKNGEMILSCATEPAIDISENCAKAYDCPYWKYCTNRLPSPSVFDLYRLRFAQKIDFYKRGLVSFDDLHKSNENFNDIQLRQIEFELNDKGTYLDTQGIRDFLSQIRYPLYFLDYETMIQPIPPFDNVRPYQQITFQYSLHYIEHEGGEIEHKEYLAESDGSDPRYKLALSLCRDIPENACVLAYNKQFECSRTNELAELYPDLSERLYGISRAIIDLITPFRNGCYYNRAMGGSFSIKKVLPAICPPLDYANLEGVHNGAEAQEIFPRIKDMSPEDAARVRHELLEYCKLDTLAMVKIWQELVRVSG